MASSSDALQEIAPGVTYDMLSDLQDEFDDVEVEIMRQQVKLHKPLLEKRAKLVAQIPNFWPLVFEQAPPDVDEYILPSDAALLLSSLKGLSVSHFEADLPNGDPRSLLIKFEFDENEYFEDSVIEKKFWFRRASDLLWTGLVSEPVEIKWKAGKDLTKGLLAASKKVWDEDQARGGAKKAAGAEKTVAETDLEKIIETTGGVGAASFFAWFGYRGRNISAEESNAANAKERARRAAKGPQPTPNEDDDDEEDWDALEVFPDGDELAIFIAEDLWSDALKYFVQAQEAEDEDMDGFESDEDDEMEDAEEDVSPSKKRKA